MFETRIDMIPERKGNRMSASLVCTKTKELGWTERKSIEMYIKTIVKSKNQN